MDRSEPAFLAFIDTLLIAVIMIISLGMATASAEETGGYGESAPGYGEGAPGYGEGAPGYGESAPGYGEGAPGYGEDIHKPVRENP